MTNRENLLDLINKSGACFECFPVGGYAEEEKAKIADYMIANGVTVQKWLPANDPPKEDFKDVLVYFEYFRYGEYNRLYRTIGTSYVSRGEWSRFVNGESGWRSLKILAWMPLPEPPMEG